MVDYFDRGVDILPKVCKYVPRPHEDVWVVTCDPKCSPRQIDPLIFFPIKIRTPATNMQLQVAERRACESEGVLGIAFDCE